MERFENKPTISLKQQYFDREFDKFFANDKNTWTTIKQTLYNGNLPEKSNKIQNMNSKENYTKQLIKYIANVE